MPDMNIADAMFEDSRWLEQVDVFKQGGTSNTNGYAIPGDGDNQSDLTVDAIVRPSRARKYQFMMEGRADGGEYLMVVDSDEDIEASDEVVYLGMKYNVQSPESDVLDGFSIYELHEVTE